MAREAGGATATEEFLAVDGGPRQDGENGDDSRAFGIKLGAEVDEAVAEDLSRQGGSSCRAWWPRWCTAVLRLGLGVHGIWRGRRNGRPQGEEEWRDVSRGGFQAAR